mmetsp:Transcript_11863/g.21453  ORF Transcript_11863/g.21453 Transcript_11863/m.21453 type:complete len:302 (-) Transcript_11863:3619-4524(-)
MLRFQMDVKSLVLSFALVLIVSCLTVQGQVCRCSQLIQPTCLLITERSVDGDGTTRCDLVTQTQCTPYQCDAEGNRACEAMALPLLGFNGTEDICTVELGAQLVLTDFRTELGAEDFAADGFTVFDSLSTQGLNVGPEGTVYYGQFTTGTDVTTDQVVFEDGGDGFGVSLVLSNQKLLFYGGGDNMLRESLPSGLVLQNTFYSVLMWFKPASSFSTPDGEYKFYLSEGIDILDLTREQIAPSAESTVFASTELGGPNFGAIGIVRILQGYPSADGGFPGVDFQGTYDNAGSVFKVWSNRSL